jgi:hypothetical protein
VANPLSHPALSRAPACTRVATRGQGVPHTGPANSSRSGARGLRGVGPLCASGAFLLLGARRSRSSGTGCGGRLRGFPAERSRGPVRGACRVGRREIRCEGDRCPARGSRARVTDRSNMASLARSGHPVTRSPGQNKHEPGRLCARCRSGGQPSTGNSTGPMALIPLAREFSMHWRWSQ